MFYKWTMISLFILWTAFNCVTASALYGDCKGDEDCGTIDTYCKDGICVCKANFVVFYDSCVELAIPKIACTKKRKHECHKALGSRSTCVEGLCACKAFHHIYNGQCVKNKDLHEICEHDYQCYCGDDCQERIGCLGNNCTCREGNIPYRSRRCITDPFTPIIQVQLSSAIKITPIMYLTTFLCLFVII